MMVSVETYLRRGQRQLRKLLLEPGVLWVLRFLAYWGSGFLLSAASLGNAPQPLAMGLCCALTGWRTLAASLGSMLGYRVFWESAGLPGMVWAGMGGVLALALGKRREADRIPLMIPMAAAFLVSATGLVFQVLGQDSASFGVYVLRVAVAGASSLLFSLGLNRRSPVTDWIMKAAATLALAQVAPAVWLNAGVAACAVFSLSSPFPGAVLTGLAVDLARITPVPMTAVACAAFFLRLIPFRQKWLCFAAPGAAGLLLMPLCGAWDLTLLPALLLGGGIGVLLPQRTTLARGRGDTGFAQVRLELGAGVMSQLQQLLVEMPPPPVDEAALLRKARDCACGSCSARNSCREQERLTLAHLHHPLEFTCRKPGRILGELRRCREQLYSMRANRSRQAEYRAALIQQYQFLSEYLRGLADQLPRRREQLLPRFRLQASARTRSRETANGDRCVAFLGPGCRYFVLLCDGMGTGLGAAMDAQSTAELLQQLLSAGFPPEHAFRSVNSILALRGQAGAVTLDLAEVRLDTGRVTLYKWGAAPSLLLSRRGTELLGAASPPPGIEVEGAKEQVLRLSLCREETLVLLSDGVRSSELWQEKALSADTPAGTLAEQILKLGSRQGEDDATAVVIRLQRAVDSPKDAAAVQRGFPSV